MSRSTHIPLSSVRRVLIIRRRALGDALVSLPAVLALRDALPHAALDLVVDRALTPLFSDQDGINVIPWDGRDRWSTPRWIQRLRRRRYDLVLDYLSTPQTAMWTALSGARWRVGFDLRWRSWAYNVRVPRYGGERTELRQFAGESFVDPLRVLGLDPEPWQPQLCLEFSADVLGTSYREWISSLVDRSRPHVGIVLSATWPAKAWPLREAAVLVRELMGEGATVILLPGPGEKGLLQPLIDEVPEVLCAPSTDLRELSDLMSRLDLLVSTDSGPRHLAAAVGVPTVTLYGPTDPTGWNQEHPLHVAVRTGETCSPCDLNTCPLADHPCMTQLTAKSVGEAVRAVLDRRQALGETTVDRNIS